MLFKQIFPSICPLLAVALDSYWDLSNRHTIFWLNIEIIWLNFSAFSLVVCYHSHMIHQWFISSHEQTGPAKEKNWSLRLITGLIQPNFTNASYSYFLGTCTLSFMWQSVFISLACGQGCGKNKHIHNLMSSNLLK